MQRQAKEMGVVFKYGPMAPGTTASGRTTWPRATAASCTPRATFTRARGSRTRPMGMGCTRTMAGAGTRGSGRMISRMGRASKGGPMALSTRACTRMD